MALAGRNHYSGMASDHEEQLARLKASEDQRARFRAEEEAKIAEERRVQEKKMDQTEALIAAIKAQVEKEKAAKEEAAKQAELKNASSNKAKKSSSDNKPKFRTISPEEMAKLEEKRKMKNAGIVPEKDDQTTGGVINSADGPIEGISGGVTGGLSGEGPSLSNLNAGGPTLSNPNAGKQTLNGSISGGLGIDITAVAPKQETKIEEKTITLDSNAINAAVENDTKQGVAPQPEVKKDDSQPEEEIPKIKTTVQKPHTPTMVVGDSNTIVVDDGSGWSEDNAGEDDAPSWVETDVHAQKVSAPYKEENKSFGETINVVPVRKRPSENNDVHSAYNIDFDDDDDDDDIISFTSGGHSEEEAARKAEEEARRKAEEEARRKAEEEARRKAEEEARRKAEEEARRKAEEEAARKAEEEARRKAEEEARRKAEEEARRKAEEEAARKAEEEARRKAEEEARRKAEEEAKRKAEEEARRKAEEEAKRKAEEEARRKAEEEARRKAEEEAARKAEEEARRKAVEEAARKAEEEARRKAEEEARRKAEEAKRVAESTASVVLPMGAEQYLGKYLTVNSINDQIVETIRYINDNPSEPRNVVILGQYGFGTTTIAEDFARSFHALGICKTKTIAKIKAAALNRANISDAISKLQGGCLVVENAGVISTEKLDEIFQIVSNPANDVVVIMTGQIDTLSKLFKDNAVISTQFKHLIQAHRITDMDVFSVAKEHAKQSGYPCDADAENQLRRRMQEVESGNLDRVLKIVDNAITKAHNREMSSGDQDHRLTAADF